MEKYLVIAENGSDVCKLDTHMHYFSLIHWMIVCREVVHWLIKGKWVFKLTYSWQNRRCSVMCILQFLKYSIICWAGNQFDTIMHCVFSLRPHQIQVWSMKFCWTGLVVFIAWKHDNSLIPQICNFSLFLGNVNKFIGFSRNFQTIWNSQPFPRFFRLMDTLYYQNIQYSKILKT